MIDLLLWGQDKADIIAFAKAYGLIVKRGEVIDNNPESPKFGQQITEGTWQKSEGFEYSWWQGSGKIMRKQATFDAEGNQLTAAQFVPGFAALCRLHGDFFRSDRLDAKRDAEQFARSKVARYIKNNGAQGQAAGITYYELNNIRILRPADVTAKLTEWGVPGHEWAGGNAF